MKLNKEILNQKVKEYHQPNFSFDELQRETLKNPMWIHFGAGNIFRAFLASKQQQLIHKSLENKGIIVAEGFDDELVDYLQKFDNLTINVTLKADGTIEKQIIGSIVKYLKMTRGQDSFNELIQNFKNPSLQMISLTITEKGYALKNQNDEYFPLVLSDFGKEPILAESYIGNIASLLYARYKAGKYPLALVSMDNMSHNGEKLEKAIMEFAYQWEQNSLVEPEFVAYLQDRSKITFPWTMIDKITPRPSENIAVVLNNDGFEEMAPVVTKKNTYVAPFVNGEEIEYLVIEDAFPNGRPQLEKVGILFTDRQTVNAVETMKVTTCLNPLHTALAIFGCILGYHSIAEEMKDRELLNLVTKLGYQEGLPVVNDPIIINPLKFIDEVVNIRLPNPFIPDSPQRIATDTSQKLAIRFGETMKSHLKKSEDLSQLVAIPLVIAGWLRYLQGTNDQLDEIILSPDPMLENLQAILKTENYSSKEFENQLNNLLSNRELFGLDLVSEGVSDKIISMYQEMNQGKGSVRKTLKRYL